MIVHKSHSKKNMIDLFAQFDIALDNSNKLNKISLINVVHEKIKEEINFKTNDFNILNKTDLIRYLEKENTEGKIDSVRKELVMDKAKNIIHWGVKCKYSLEASQYDSIQTIFTDTIYISKYGFIPSVRRACKIHNECIYKIDHVNPILPLKTQRKMEQKKQMKSACYYNVKFSRGNFLISFD